MDVFDSLSRREQELIVQLKAEVQGIVQAHPALQVFCSDWTYVRYMRARSWDLTKASKMLKATLQWRLETKPHLITWDMVEKEAKTGKTFVSLFHDKNSRPVVVMRPRNQNTKDEAEQLQYLIYCLEHASRAADRERVGKMTWLIDFEGYSMRNAPPVRTSINVMSILQNHYPERLGGAVCYHAPGLFSLTWKAVAPFIDPVTKKKIAFVDKGSKGEIAAMEEWFDLDHIEPCMGGQHAGDLFVLPEYRERMRQEDQDVAAAVQMVGSRTGGSLESDLSETGAFKGNVAGGTSLVLVDSR